MPRINGRLQIFALLGILFLAAATVPKCESAWCFNCGKRHGTAYLFGARVGMVDSECRLSPFLGRNWSESIGCPHTELSNNVEHGSLALLLKYHPWFCPICNLGD
jgi:hypothetical protein